MPRASRKSTNTLANRVTNDIVATVTGAGKRLSKTVTGSSDNILTKTTDVAGRTVTGTVDTATDTLASTVDYTGNVATDFVDALQDVVSGLIDGASSVVETTGDVTERLLTDVFDIRATHVFSGAGNLVRRVANGIGGVMREIPYVGNTTGYVVESAGGGVYHVILSVGKLVGSTSRRLGSVAKKTSDLVVFTLNASDEQLRDTTHSVDELIQRLSATLSGSEGKSLRQAGGRGRRSRRNARRNTRNVRNTRGGGRGGVQRRRRSMRRNRGYGGHPDLQNFAELRKKITKAFNEGNVEELESLYAKYATLPTDYNNPNREQTKRKMGFANINDLGGEFMKYGTRFDNWHNVITDALKNKKAPSAPSVPPAPSALDRVQSNAETTGHELNTSSQTPAPPPTLNLKE